MNFINRNDELFFLNKEYQKDNASLIIIYGRRRIGKTSLIQEFIKDKNHHYFLATEENELENIKSFKDLLTDQDNKLINVTINDWYTLFDYYLDINSTEKKILVIDEFQYLGITNPAFPSILQKIFDTKLKNKNIMVILCGSLVSLMESQTLSYSSPLYGRRTGQIKLKQIRFNHYYQFFNNLDKKTMIEFYAITGGVPKYIELFDQSNDVFTNIIENILNKQSFLYDEPFYLLQKEVSEIGSYFSIIKSIAAGNTKLSSISKDIQISQTTLPKYLKILINLDILERIVPITEDNPEKSKQGLYKIKDNFILFWFRFVYPNYSRLEVGNINYVINKIKSNFIENHVSYIYEDICKSNLLNIEYLSISTVGKWWNRNNEIDIVALDDENKTIIFGECKYYNNKLMGLKEFYDLEVKSNLVEYKDYHKKKYVLFCINGYDEKLVELANRRNDLILFEH